MSVGRDFEWPKGSGRTAFYEDHELAIIRGLMVKCEAGEITEAQLGKEVGVIHDLKVTFEGSAFMAAEAPVLVPDAEGEPMSLFGTGRFPVPEKARRKLGERDFQTQMPPTTEPPPEPEPGPTWEPPTTTAGIRGGAVPTLGDRWLPALLGRYPDESRAVRAAIMMLALEHGEYHSDMIDKTKLSEPSIVGGAVGTLVRAGKIVEVSRRMSENEVRRAKSGVYTLTPEGRAIAQSLTDRMENP